MIGFIIGVIFLIIGGRLFYLSDIRVAIDPLTRTIIYQPNRWMVPIVYSFDKFRNFSTVTTLNFYALTMIFEREGIPFKVPLYRYFLFNSKKAAEIMIEETRQIMGISDHNIQPYKEELNRL